MAKKKVDNTKEKLLRGVQMLILSTLLTSWALELIATVIIQKGWTTGWKSVFDTDIFWNLLSTILVMSLISALFVLYSNVLQLIRQPKFKILRGRQLP